MYRPDLSAPKVMHLDMNSCFASIEQQANPLYRHKPLVVAAYAKPFGCILASSYEAKALGIKTGMRVKEGTAIYKQLIVLEPDVEKYRYVHKSLKKILSDYTPLVVPKSIDEFVLDFREHLSYATKDLINITQIIKNRIRREIGSHITVSVGIGTNRFLAKTAADFQKPDGLTVINDMTIGSTFNRMELTDICGISTRNAIRLHTVGIFSAADFLRADIWQLKSAFKSVVAEYWYLRLRGFELDDTESGRKTVGNSYILPHATPVAATAPVMAKLIHKMSERLRQMNFRARGIHLLVRSPVNDYWHKGEIQPVSLASPGEFYQRFYRLLRQVNFTEVKGVAVTAFSLISANSLQLNLFTDAVRTERLAQAMDEVNNRYGDYTLTSARVLPAANAVPDRIAFGGVRELV